MQQEKCCRLSLGKYRWKENHFLSLQRGNILKHCSSPWGRWCYPNAGYYWRSSFKGFCCMRYSKDLITPYSLEVICVTCYWWDHLRLYDLRNYCVNWDNSLKKTFSESKCFDFIKKVVLTRKKKNTTGETMFPHWRLTVPQFLKALGYLIHTWMEFCWFCWLPKSSHLRKF